MKEKIKIYTDGAARGNPGRAGWGVVVLVGSKQIELGGGSSHATNNQMELSGAIEALKFLKINKLRKTMPIDEVEIISDSKYVILGITEWIDGWMRNGWRNAAKKPVMNRELWEELYILNQEFKPKWKYIEGHAGHHYNERADVIATSFADGEPVELRMH